MNVKGRVGSAPSKDWRSVIFENRALIGTFIMSIVLLLARPTIYTIAVGITLGSLGLSIRIWAAGYIIYHRVYSISAPELIILGPYSIVRNPLYWGNFFIGLGLVVASNRVICYPLFFLAFLLVYLPIISYEEEYLLKRFKGEYLKYKNMVPRLIPSLSHYNAAANRFSRVLALREESSTCLLFFLAVVLLIIKSSN